jgi:hypothetical protein
LAQGPPGVTNETNTISFLSPKQVWYIPTNRTVTYGRILIDHCPQTEDHNHVCITVGVNLINYPVELTMHTTDMVLFKLLWNSMISMKGARFAGANIKNMYLDMLLNW